MRVHCAPHRHPIPNTLPELRCAYFRAQIMESSQTLLHVLKRESVNLTKKKQTSS